MRACGIFYRFRFKYHNVKDVLRVMPLPLLEERTNLTHKEAFESEELTRKEITLKFPEPYKKAVLATVHHSK